MSTVDESQTRRERSMLYLVIGVVIVLVMILGVILFRAADDTDEARAKADELIQALDDAGARVTPTQDRVVALLGNDGGAVCANPNAALSRATLHAQLRNGATGPGERPVISPRQSLQGQLLIMQIYCPDELAEFQEFVDSLKTTDQA